MRNAHNSGSQDSYIVVSTLENTGIEKKKVSKGPKGSTEKRKLWRCGDFFFRTQKNVRSRSVTTVPDFMEPNSGNPKK